MVTLGHGATLGAGGGVGEADGEGGVSGADWPLKEAAPANKTSGKITKTAFRMSDTSDGDSI